jgi:hypothetical protein
VERKEQIVVQRSRNQHRKLVNKIAERNLNVPLRDYLFRELYSIAKFAIEVGIREERTRNLRRGLAGELEFNRLAQKVAYNVLELLQPAIQKLYSDLEFGALTFPEAKKLLWKKLDELGLGHKNFYLFETHLRTAVNEAYNGRVWINSRADEEVWGFRYQTYGDQFVRDEHIAQQGVTLPKFDPFWTIWWPPNGWNCRCRIEVLYEEEFIVPPDFSVQPEQGFVGNDFAGV